MITGKISLIKNKEKEIAFPVTSAEAVYMPDGKTTVNEQLETMTNYLTYEMFGAKGDGITDDSEAIKLCHEQANLLGLNVKANSSKYLISSNKNIPIKTNVDWNNCVFLVNENEANFIFNIASNESSYAISLSTKINTKTTYIEELKDIKKCMLVVENSNKKQYIRYGVNADTGQNQKDIVIVSNGYVETEFVWDFDIVTSAIVYPIDENIIEIKNATFKSKANTTMSDSYIENGIIISRSNVIIDNVNHILESDAVGQPNKGFYFMHYASNVLFKNSSTYPRTYRNNIANTAIIGTYDIGVYNCCNITFDSIEGFSLDESKWGVMGGNYIKNLTVKNSKVNRIDCHKALYGNTLIENTILGNYGLMISGGGNLHLKNITTHAQYVINLRDDYGSTWDGDIILENITHKSIKEPTIFKVYHAVNHDFGYDCRLGKNLIKIDGYNVDVVDGIKDYCLLKLDVTPKTNANGLGSNEYKLAKVIDIKNAYLNDKEAGFYLFNTTIKNLYADNNFDYNVISENTVHDRFLYIKPNIYVNLENIQLVITEQTKQYGHLFNTSSDLGIGSGSDDYVSINNRVLPNFNIKNCKNLQANLYGLPSILNIDNSNVRGIITNQSGSRNILNVNNSNFNVRCETTINGGYGIRVNRGSSFFNSCTFLKPNVDGADLVCAGNSNDNLIRKAFDFLGDMTSGKLEFKVYGNFNNCIFDNEMNFNKLISVNYVRQDFGKIGNTNYNDRFIQNLNSTANRPTNPPLNFMYYDVTLAKPIWWNGSVWKDASGTTV